MSLWMRVSSWRSRQGLYMGDGGFCDSDSPVSKNKESAKETRSVILGDYGAEVVFSPCTMGKAVHVGQPSNAHLNHSPEKHKPH